MQRVDTQANINKNLTRCRENQNPRSRINNACWWIWRHGILNRPSPKEKRNDRSIRMKRKTPANTKASGRHHFSGWGWLAVRSWGECTGCCSRAVAAPSNRASAYQYRVCNIWTQSNKSVRKGCSAIYQLLRPCCLDVIVSHVSIWDWWSRPMNLQWCRAQGCDVWCCYSFWI